MEKVRKVRPARPLSAKELQQLEGYENLDRRPPGRTALISFVLGAVGGLVLALALAPPGSDSTWTFTEDITFLQPVEDAIGSTATAYLLSALLFGGGMALVSWRLVSALHMHRRTLLARLDQYGTEDDPVAHM